MQDNIKGIPIEQVVAKYNELGNVWRVGEMFGISGQTIHARLKRLGIIKPINSLSADDIKVLKEKYTPYKMECRLQELADEMGRTKQFICRKARELGLTGRPTHYNLPADKKAQLSQSAKNRIKKYGHPKGALGLTHTDESRAKMSKKAKLNWLTNHDEWCSEERRMQRSDSMMRSYEKGVLGVRSRCYLWRVSVGGKEFLAKSSWEYDIALYLEYLKQCGLISEWGYETKVFRFKYNRLGVRTYRPDFSVMRGPDLYYIEVKGWEDKKYHIKRRLMAKEFPSERIIYIRAKEYKMIEKKHSNELTGWGSMKEMAGKQGSKCSVDGCENPVHSKGLCRHHFYEAFHR